MARNIMKHGLLATAALFAVAVVSPAVAGAQPARAQEAQTQAQTQVQTQTEVQTQVQTQTEAQAQQEVTRVREEAAGRLEAAKLKACEKREKAIQNIFTRFSATGAKQLEVFTTISERTQAFYVKQGNTVANYDELVAEVNAKRTAAEAAVEAVKSGAADFDCEAADPKAIAQSFKTNLQARNAALKDYKLAIKDLIVAVKSAQSDTEGEQ